MAPTDDSGNLARMRWRARRGTRELDRLMGWWLDARYASADALTRDTFDALLDESDPDLWDWLIARGEPPQRFAAIVDEIRTRHRL